jgi:hypothetical protein
LYDNGTTQTVSFSDSVNGAGIGTVTPTQIGSEVVIGTDRYRHYRANNITGFTGTVTATWGASSSFGSILVTEVGGVIAAAFDAGAQVSQASPGTGTDALTVSATAAGSSGIIVAFSINDSANRVPVIGTGFSDQGGNFWKFGGPSPTGRLESKALPGSGSQAATWTVAASGGSDNYANFIGIYLDAGGDTLMGQVLT